MLANLETSKKVLGSSCSAQHAVVRVSSARNGTNLQRLYPHKTTEIHKLYDVCGETWLNFVNWYLHWMHHGKVDPTLGLFNYGAWPQLLRLSLWQVYGRFAGNVIMWCQGWCMVCSEWNWDCWANFSSSETINSHRYITHSDIIFECSRLRQNVCQSSAIHLNSSLDRQFSALFTVLVTE
jgi:hypothetical protein